MSVVVTLDGHDASGKSTLARLLAERVGATVVRPFAGATGDALMGAVETGDPQRVLDVGESALQTALESNVGGRAVFDRGWITVSTLARSDDFERRWAERLPTVVCWADLDITLARLASRDEPDEALSWHRDYLVLYRQIAESAGVPLLRTDHGRDPRDCIAELLERLGPLR